MKTNKLIAFIFALSLAFTALSGCTSSTDSGSQNTQSSSSTEVSTNENTSDTPTIKIGIVNPITGVLAGFGDGTPWVEQHVVDYVNVEMGGIYIEEYDAKLPVELIVYDCESNSTKTTELTQKLIQEDGVHLMLSRHCPEIVNPITASCERFEMPCVSTDAPMNAWQEEGPYEWSFHGHWDLKSMYECYQSMWTTAGFPKDSGAKIGLFFANDADGTAWNNIFSKRIPEDGYELFDPGMFPTGTQDFTKIISQFKSENVDILIGAVTNSDFSTMWRQCKQMDYQPQFVTMGKAYLLKSDAMAIGPELMDGLCSEVWWAPSHPWKSSLTGETPSSLAEVYAKETGRQITAPMGAKYYGVEIAIDAITRAASLDNTALRDAIAETDLDTIFGHVKFESDHGWRSSLTGGQWVMTPDGDLELVVIDNSLFPDIPTTGEMKRSN